MIRLVLAVSLASLWSMPVMAGDRDEIAMLKSELKSITARLATLEAKQSAAAKAPEAPRKAEPVVNERLKLNADFRYRHESIDEDGKEERVRQRVRARVGVTAKVSDSADVVMQLASGGADPISANQSLGDAGSTKNVGIDLAYFTLKPTKGQKLVAGKMKNPFYLPGKSSLIWDGDYNPEGLAWSYAQDNFFARITGQWIEERKAAANAIMLGGQAGATARLAGGSKLTVGAGYYDYGATRGRAAFFDGDGRGNTLDAMGNYVFDYEILELFAEVDTQLGEMPFSVYADWVNNGTAGPQDSGSAIGARVGKASAPGTWEFGYAYTDLEADAVVAMFTDSDIGGGGTAISGHRLDLAYAFDKKIKAKLTYFISENESGTPSERDYNRLQADVSLKY